uniref:U3 small nucleolar RNA-associated protein 14 n=1 Tax=Timema poppense TaxID=170557 RepID=A0A7R9H9B6_TIMPO|nr:unnamed protein product [Timema poppensis]
MYVLQYHRLQRRENVRKQLKNFEQLKKEDPEAALRQLEQIERSRAEERMTLRHRSTGKWAHSKAIRANRQVLAEQLAISRDLTQKLRMVSTSSDEDKDDEVEVTDADGVKKSEIDEFVSGYRKFWEEQNQKKALTNVTVSSPSKNVSQIVKNKSEQNNKVEKLKILTSVVEKVEELTEDPNDYLKIKPKYLRSEHPDLSTGGDEEKKEAVIKSTPQNIDLSMPGWGDWAGQNLSVSKRKKRRFVIKVPKDAPRRDENKGNVIINQEKDVKVKQHQVSDLPFPFESVKDFEASMRAPIGNNWVPEMAHRKMIRPEVLTKMGTVIQPMDNASLIIKKKKCGRKSFFPV